MRCGGVGPCVAKGFETRFLGGDRRKRVQQVAGGSRQAVEPCHGQHVAGVEVVEQPAKLRAVDPGRDRGALVAQASPTPSPGDGVGDVARSWRGADFAHRLGTKNALVVVVFLVVVGLAGVVLVVLLVLVVGFVDVHSDTPVAAAANQ